MSAQVISLKADEAINWFQKRIKNAVNYGLSSEDSKLFEIFITSTLSDVDIKKQISNTVLPSFFENIVTRKVDKPTISAQASIIRLFMKYYGGSCGQFKSLLDKFTYKSIKECFDEDNIMFKVTKYLALYPQCGGRGQQGINHAEAWTNQFNGYLYSANYLLNQLYSNVNFFSGINVEENYEGQFDISVFDLANLGQSSPKERYEKLASIFLFFNTAIQSMLLSMFSTVKHIDADKVLQFALRTVSVTSEKLNATIITEDVIALDSVLWKLHCSVLKTISALIKCCSRNLIPQGISICRFLLLSLNMTYFNSSNFTYGTTRSKLQQRVLTYQVLRSWLVVAGSQSSLEMFSENLTFGILFDIKYDKPSLNLIVDKQTGGKKRKSGTLNEKIINQRDTIIMHDYHANETICNEAHKTLAILLDTTCSNLKHLQFQMFQSTIMSLLLEITKCQRPNDYPLPYYNDLCRINLYKSLLVTVTSPHPQSITQTSVAVRLFTLGSTDHNEKIKEICRSSLSKLEHIIRPRNDTLFFPLEGEVEIPQSVKNAIPENKTHFLSDTILDSTMLNKIDNIKPIMESSEIASATNVSEFNDDSTSTPKELILNINNEDQSTSNSQEAIIKNVEVSINEKPQEIQIISPIVTEISHEFSVETTKNVDVVQSIKTIEPMDVLNKIDVEIVHQATIDQDTENDAIVEEMFNDFIDDL